MIVAVTTCMGRLYHLRRTLHRMVSNLRMSIVVVDYACPDRCGDWVESQRYHPEVEVLRITSEQARRSSSGRPLYHRSHANNLGAARAMELGATKLVFIDADNIAGPDLGKHLNRFITEDRFVVYPADRDQRDLGGFPGVPVSAFLSAGRYDESIVDWGGDDQDLKLRLLLKARLGFSELTRSMLQAIPHSDGERSVHCVEKSIYHSSQRNAWIVIKNAMMACPGAKFEDVFARSDVIRLLGCELRIQ